jgi:pyrroline-5-carboxylate reductase
MQVGFIGSGNMATALARGLGEPVLCTDSGSGRAQRLVDELGGEVVSNAECAERAEILVLAHKPYQLDAVAAEIDPRRVVVSILGNVDVDTVRRAYPKARTVLRLEPNTPSELRRGVLIFAESESPDAPAVHERFSVLGTVVELPDRLVGTAGAVSGVGPAYWALFVEAWTDAAVRHGIPAEKAATLVTETMAGTAALLTHTDTLSARRAVTSPGGSTARGLNALEQGGVRAALANAMDAVVEP